MANIFAGSLSPYLDSNGAPMVGAQAFFYDANTTTPRVVYTESGLNTAAGIDDRTAGSTGLFPPIFLPEGDYRLKILDADGATYLDIDGLTAPPLSEPTESGGDTPTELLFQTGDIKVRYGTGTLDGFVRLNGRSIGNASSSATERANADTEDLFEYLWGADSNLSVSGGRGANAAADYAANKRLTLPDLRGRVLAGLDDMGSTAAGVLTGLTTLGEVMGDEEHILTSAQLAAHTHTGNTSSDGAHGHPFRLSTTSGGDSDPTGGLMLNSSGIADQAAWIGALADTAGRQIGSVGSAHSHAFTTGSSGTGEAHPNVQPTMGVTIYVKL